VSTPSMPSSYISFSIASMSVVLTSYDLSAICFAGAFSIGCQSVTTTQTPISFAFLTISQDSLELPSINNRLPLISAILNPSLSFLLN